MNAERLKVLVACLNDNEIATLVEQIGQMCNDLALDNAAITVPFVTSISTFTEDDVEVKTGNHRVKVWLRVYPKPDDREFYVWPRLSRPLEDEGPFTFDRVQFTWKAPQD